MAQILVIDDDRAILTALHTMLETIGHDVATTDSGDDAIDICCNGHVDLVITDLFMPEKEGLEIIMELKKKAPDIKIIAISGGCYLNIDSLLPLASELGATRTISKPFTFEQIKEVVNNVLENND